MNEEAMARIGSQERKKERKKDREKERKKKKKTLDSTGMG
jgi:hypothetical protein